MITNKITKEARGCYGQPSRSHRNHSGIWNRHIRTHGQGQGQIPDEADRRHPNQSGRKIPKEALCVHCWRRGRMTRSPSRMSLSVPYTQTGVLTRILSKLISSNFELTPARTEHNHMDISIYHYELITTRELIIRFTSRRCAVNACRDNKTLTASGQASAMAAMSDLCLGGVMSTAKQVQVLNSQSCKY